MKCLLGDLITQRREKNNGESLPICGLTKEGFIPPKQQNADTSIYNLFYYKDFVFNPARMELNSIVFNDVYEKAICSSLYEIFYVRRTDLILPEYLGLWVKRNVFTRYCEFLGSGSAREYCRVSNISEMEIEFPDIKIQEKKVKQYKVLKERIRIKQKINDNLVDTLQTLYKRQFIESEVIYPHKTLGEICSKIGSGATPKGGKTAYYEEGISLIRSTNVFDFNFSYTDLAHISDVQANALSNVIVEANDVLFNITGVSVARCCMVPNDVLPARVNQHVMIIRPTAGKYMSYYLMAALCSTDNKSKLLGIGQSGSTREAINKQEIESFVLPIPPIDEIVQFGKQADTIYNQIEANINETQYLEELQHILLAQLSSR